MKNTAQKNDEELAELTLKDNKYFEPLVERYEQKLTRYIKRLTGLSIEYIEDILQEVFIKIYRNLNNFDTSLKFSSWAYRIAHNEAVNHFKKYKREETVTLEADEEDAINLINILESDTDIKKEVAQKEISGKVRNVLYLLPKKYRDVIVLFYLEEKSYEEISDILQKPSGTVATLLNRAKSKFKELAQKQNLKPLT